MNSSHQILSKSINLIYNEDLFNLDVVYSDLVLVYKEYTITATVLSGTNVTIDFKVSIVRSFAKFYAVNLNLQLNDNSCFILDC